MKKLLIAAAVIALTGCMTIGRDFDITKADQLKPGVTTITEATELLGKPTSIHTDRVGKKMLQWSYIKSGFERSSARLAVVFSQDGKMERIAQQSEQ